MSIIELFHPSLISFLDVETRDDAIHSMIDLLDQCMKLPDKEAFCKAVFERERIVSTGIGMGVAIPHAKLKGFSEFFISLGIQKQKGLDWKALDQAPVRLIFMIGGPDHQQQDYLHILSALTSIIKDGEIRKKILKAESAKEVFSLISEFSIV